MAWWHLLLQLLLICLTAAAATSMAKPGCPERCGNVNISYPFGIGDGCSIDGHWFDVICNESYHPPKPFILDAVYELFDISVLEGRLTVDAFVASKCYNRSGKMAGYDSEMFIDGSGPYTFSNTRNKFTALGCDTQAYISGFLSSDSNSSYTSGCVSFCSDEVNAANGTCSGIGCCQTSIPIGATGFVIWVRSSNNHSEVLGFNPCSYAFLIADDGFKFSKKDLAINGKYGDGKGKLVPVVLDWVIGNDSCISAQRNSSAYACKSENSTCYNWTNGPGYRCNCSQGYEGNPYLEGGCKDIDECITGNYTCRVGVCKNKEGSYDCKANMHIIMVILGIGLSLLFVLIAGSFIYWGLKKRKIILLKEKFFRQNGGLLLQQQITSHGVAVTTKIFSAEELERATKKYAEDRIIGRGGYGTVYKGILPDNTTVAIKKSKIVDETQIEQFINEVFILSQINHRNVVKLLGCCLETEVPLLVYEFISNGTLFHHIHDEAHSSSISFADRLRVASETAGALDYLHSAASIPIFHRDVKSTNILLDHNLTAKVADFGASRLVPLDQTQLNTLVQGTLGYLDPEYFQTGQLTEKSDVYSFGVVLVELLTGEKPICTNRSQEERNLSMYFILSMKENRLFGVLENRVVDEGGVEQLLAVARLAKRCLKVKGEERPTMKEVAMELEGLRGFVEHPWVQSNHEETQSLLGELEIGYSGNGNVAGQDSSNNHTMSAMEIGR